MLSEEKIKLIKEKYKNGMQVELESMSDTYAIANGTKGVIDHVDSVGTIHVNWENGSNLGLIVGEDKFNIINNEKNVIENLGMGKCIILKESNQSKYCLIYALTSKQFIVVSDLNKETGDWIHGCYFGSNLNGALEQYDSRVKTNDITISEESFKSYLELQKSGVINMNDIISACEITGLDKKTYINIINNYSLLKETYQDAYNEIFDRNIDI